MALILLRILERVTAVVIGGLSIYLGYRLFRAVKATGEGMVEVKLPHDVTVMMSRVAPGVFFALFGAVLVGASLVFPVRYSESDLQAADGQSLKKKEFAGIGEAPSEVPAARVHPPVNTTDAAPNKEGLELARLQVRQYIAFLNQLPGVLDPALPEPKQRRVRRDTLATKLQLMHAVWDKDWGRFEDFGLWAEGGRKAGDSEEFRRAAEFFAFGQEQSR